MFEILQSPSPDFNTDYSSLRVNIGGVCLYNIEIDRIQIQILHIIDSVYVKFSELFELSGIKFFNSL